MSGLEKRSSPNWWPFRPQISTSSPSTGANLMQFMLVRSSSSAMQKAMRSMISLKRSPDQSTALSAGNGLKSWNQEDSLAGSLYLRRPCSMCRCLAAGSSFRVISPGGRRRISSQNFLPCTPTSPPSLITAGYTPTNSMLESVARMDMLSPSALSQTVRR